MKRHQPTEEDGKVALRDHVVEKALEARRRYPNLEDAEVLAAFLQDDTCVRFPTELSFDATFLQEGEFAWAAQRGDSPKDGYVLHVHPRFRTDRVLPRLVAYHVARINYGDIVTSREAELYGSALLGLDVEEYYQSLCRAADSLSACGGAS